MEEIAQAIETVLGDWPAFFRYCLTQSIAYPAMVPNLKFFSRCITQAMDFTVEIMKPVAKRGKLKVYNPDGSVLYG